MQVQDDLFNALPISGMPEWPIVYNMLSASGKTTLGFWGLKPGVQSLRAPSLALRCQGYVPFVLILENFESNESTRNSDGSCT